MAVGAFGFVPVMTSVVFSLQPPMKRAPAKANARKNVDLNIEKS
jgi:hypothetical protein